MTEVPLFLSMLRPGQSARVCRVLPAGAGVARMLSAIGILPGVVLTVTGGCGGPLLVRIGDGRFAVGRGLAQRVMVIPGD
jgi:ferrous iron transport protein A